MGAPTKIANPSVGELRALYRYMAPLWFVASREELLAEGFGPSRISNWCRTGRLVKVIRGVYSFGRDVESREAAWRAGLLAPGSGAALTGRSALEAWGIVRPGRGLPRLIEVGVDSGGARRLNGLSPALRGTTVKVMRRQFEPDELRAKDRLALTAPAVALVDFAADSTDRDVRFAFLEACRLKLFNKPDLSPCFVRLTGRRGARKLRPYLSLWVPELSRIRSVLEGWFLLVWVERGYPMPKVNWKVGGYEVDFYWEEWGLVLELDGASFHHDPARRRIDREKQMELEAQGLTVLRVTSTRFEADPEAVVDWVAGHLHQG